MRFLENINKSLLIIVIFLASVLLSYKYIDFGSNMSVATGHVYLAKSLALDHTFKLNNYWQNAGVDVITVNGDYYLPYAPLNAILMAIPYIALQIIYYFYTNSLGEINGDISIIFESFAFSLPSSLALLGILLLLKKYCDKFLKLSKSQLGLLLIATSFGTLLFIYSLSFFHHLISAFLIFAAFYLLNSQAKNKYIFAGILTGAAFLTEFLTAFFSIALLIAEFTNLVRRKKTFKQVFSELIQFAIPVAVAIGLILTYNHFIFGGPLIFGESIFIAQRTASGIDWDGFRENPLYGLYGSMFSPLKGLFVYSPFLLFAILGLQSFFKSHKYQATLATSYVVILTVLYSMWSDCFGATVYGTRYLIGVIPFWCLIAAYSFETIYKSSILKNIFYIAVALSIFVNTTNSIFGIAQSKMEQCDVYLNTYTPYHRIVEATTYKGQPIKLSPAIIDFYRDKYFPDN